MKLPEQIPKRLRSMALPLAQLDYGEGAWSKSDAMAVIESLKSTTVAVSDVVVFNYAPWGYAPSDVAISIVRLAKEADADYAARSRLIAKEFVQNFEPILDDTLFALTFPLWKNAA